MMLVDRHKEAHEDKRWKHVVDLPRPDNKDSNHNGFELILQLQLQDEWNRQDKYGKICDDAHDTGYYG